MVSLIIVLLLVLGGMSIMGKLRLVSRVFKGERFIFFGFGLFGLSIIGFLWLCF